MNTVKTFLVTFVVFFAIDLLWLGVVAKNLYAKYLGYLMAPNVNWIAAVSFYVLFIIGIIYFVLNPNLNEGFLSKVMISGALFGLITYATYDLTNLATIKDWPIAITVIDLIWGTTLSTLTSVISFIILRKMI